MTATDFIPTRAAGLERLAAFLPRAGRHYASQRNYDRGPDRRENVSGLSPYVRHRLVTEVEVVRAVLGAHGLRTAEKFVQEQFWRIYWKGWLELRPTVWSDWQAGLAAARRRLDTDPALRRDHEAALVGRTGIDCFDAWVRELAVTGYLHNHTRMWFASIWIFTLRLPWELGAALFLRHLLDGDLASNTLSWRWVAGLQTRGKTYLARAFNIREYTEGRFDPTGLAADAPALEGPEPPPPLAPPRTDPPDPDLRTGLLLHEDDLHPESLELPVRPVAVAVGQGDPLHGPEGTEPTVAFWVEGALAATADRAQTCFGGETTMLPRDVWVDAVTEWARSAGIRQLVTPYAPVGPVRDRLDVLEPRLAAHGIRLVRLLRPEDAACWPHATKGFFAFKEKIPGLIRRLGPDG